MIVLPGRGGNDLCLRVSLRVITDLETAHGSLYLVSERLLDKSLPLGEVVVILKFLYRAAGCTEEDEALESFLLQQPCTELLASVLLGILDPIERMGALSPGEGRAAPSGEFT